LGIQGPVPRNLDPCCRGRLLVWHRINLSTSHLHSKSPLHPVASVVFVEVLEGRVADGLSSQSYQVRRLCVRREQPPGDMSSHSKMRATAGRIQEGNGPICVTKRTFLVENVVKT
jgi:hypothetical protein